MCYRNELYTRSKAEEFREPPSKQVCAVEADVDKYICMYLYNEIVMY